MRLLSRPRKVAGTCKGGWCRFQRRGIGSAGAGVGGGGKPAERSLAKEHAAPEAEAQARRRAWRSRRLRPPRRHPPRPCPHRPRRARHECGEEVREEGEARAAADEESAAGPEEGKPATKSKASAETAVERANRLFTEGRWAEASAAYRELLRRDPNNAEAARWRQRLAVAEAALESRRTTEPARAAPAH